MKNKKIILGLGTITALGAMSVGFIACVKKKEIEDMNLSKLTKEQVKELLANVSTLTEAQMKNLIANLSTLTKEEMQEIIKDSQDPKKTAKDIFNLEAKAYLDQKKENDNIRKNSDIGHFNSGITAEDVTKRINENMGDKKWTVVPDPNRDDIVGNNTKEVLKQNGRTIEDGEKSITFKLAQKFDNIGEIVTDELTFNFFVGQKNLSTITDKNIHHSAIDETKIAEQLNKKEEFKNVNLTKEDFGIVKNSKKEPEKNKTGEIKIKAKDGNKKISGEVTLILGTVKQGLKETHLTGFDATNNTTAQDVKDHINKQTGFNEKGNNISEADFDFAKDDATLNHIGKIKITPKGKTEGESFTIDIPKLIDLKTVITNLALGELANNGEAAIKAEIKKKFPTITKDEYLEITSITTTTAKVKGKGIYGGEVDVTFTIATTTPD